MITLSEAVAQELRAELAVRQWHMDELAVKSGRSKSTGWRHIKGKSRLSIDDVEAYAHGLGWSLDTLVARARARQRADAIDQLTASPEGHTGSIADPAIRAAVEAADAQAAERRRKGQPNG